MPACSRGAAAAPHSQSEPRATEIRLAQSQVTDERLVEFAFFPRFLAITRDRLAGTRGAITDERGAAALSPPSVVAPH